MFNIRVGFGEHEVTLTILPTSKKDYLVIYFGGILGAVRMDPDGELWEQVPDEEILPSDLPLYKPDLEAEWLDIVLCEDTVADIGDEISAVLRGI
ncbi:MAG: hypothetical protein P0Y49_08495 [Candidatus Pedobacter colombiensis]|uniref:Uncharacterized protein n=1 Tax=Candidatus Pedobacter colombiensis TaxID=3121371 RepID=A0AAJ5WBV8_9SPHI|nr:hypothetical protein [Pedobacter sp.]WEK21178.1 MAG: hypothetical protein P0Y49_08495 [Pedobacter sp.]